MIVIAIVAVTFALVKGDDVGVAHVLRDMAFLPAQAQKLVELLQ